MAGFLQFMISATINTDYGSIEGFIRRLPEIFDGNGGKTLYEGRNTVKMFAAGGLHLVVKRFKRPNMIQCAGYATGRPGKARRAYRFAEELRRRGFSTPHEIAFIEQRKGFMLTDSYFVSEECMLPPLSSLLRRKNFDRRPADALAAELVKMHDRGVMHGDLNLTNILYEQRPADGAYAFTFIDTNRSHFKDTPLSYNECTANLMRLSHDRPLLEYLVRSYASSRGWNADKTAGDVITLLDRFERRRERKYKIKNLFGKKTAH